MKFFNKVIKVGLVLQFHLENDLVFLSKTLKNIFMETWVKHDPFKPPLN
jgi:hypothetical protein